MKIWKNAISLFSLLLIISSCNPSGDDDITPDPDPENLPESITEFIDANFRDYKVEDAEEEDFCDDRKVYEIEIEDGPGPDMDLFFSADGEFLFAALEISRDDIPDAVLQTIENEFAGYQIKDDDIERFELADGSKQFEVELEFGEGAGTGLEVVFNEDGSVFCQKEEDNDEDEGKEDDDKGEDKEDGGEENINLPDDTYNFIKDNYTGYDIEDVEKEDLCDESEAYEVELEDGPGKDLALYFNLDWEFLFTATEISMDDLPAAVLATIESDFSDYELEKDDLEEFELADGTFQYYVEFEDGDLDEIIFNADGTIACRKD